MEIILGKTAGFCYGVKRAVQDAKKELKNAKEVYCLGEIVHNKSVIENLKNEGMIFTENLDDIKGEAIIRAHGASKEVYETLKEKNIIIIDLTCPNVLKTHELASEYSKKDYFVILIGIKNHPESIGTLSFCGDNSELIQEKEDIECALEKIEKSRLENVFIMAQTTYNSKKFDEMVKILEDKLPNKKITVKKTICNATEIRQRETIDISKKADCMIIIGDKKSSNTNKLYDISKENCKKVLFIQNANELNIKELDGINVIGIMAGASTPEEDINEVLEKVEG